MKIYEVSERTTKLLTNIIKVWEQSVRATHLFLSPKERGKGIGRQLLQYEIHNYEIREVTVNEQNPQAVGFYEHMGFAAYKRTDLDEQGNPYPLLYMKRGWVFITDRVVGKIENDDANLLTGFEKATNAVNHFLDKRWP